MIEMFYYIQNNEIRSQIVDTTQTTIALAHIPDCIFSENENSVLIGNSLFTINRTNGVLTKQLSDYELALKEVYDEFPPIRITG